jgi:hypothetical protein
MPEKAKKRGRPVLPKGKVKAKYVPVRLSADDLKAFTRAMKSDGHKTLSGWIRHTLREAVKNE